jgi:hypothetical protein
LLLLDPKTRPYRLESISQFFILVFFVQLSGTIPTELGKLKKLKALDVHDNNLVSASYVLRSASVYMLPDVADANLVVNSLQVGSVPKEICDLRLEELVVDCLGPKPEVSCSCCTKCCRGLPDPKCIDVASGKQVY